MPLFVSIKLEYYLQSALWIAGIKIAILSDLSYDWPLFYPIYLYLWPGCLSSLPFFQAIVAAMTGGGGHSEVVADKSLSAFGGFEVGDDLLNA